MTPALRCFSVCLALAALPLTACLPDDADDDPAAATPDGDQHADQRPVDETPDTAGDETEADMQDGETDPDAIPDMSAGDDIDGGEDPDQTPPAPDFGSGAGQVCPVCAEGELCVQYIDGTCGMSRPVCRPDPLGCRAQGCSRACELHFCGMNGEPFGTCDGSNSCGGEAREAFRCWGP